MQLIALVIVAALVLPVVIGTVVVVARALRNDSGPVAAAPDDFSQRPLIPPFGAVRFRVGDSPRAYCALLASTVEAQVQGMQNRRDLGGYDAMVFAFAGDEQVSFTNHFVPIDLDIGWYDKAGALVDVTTMAKCPDGVDCPTYAARDVFRYAVETPAGGLSALGLAGSGATLHVGGAC